MISLKRLIIYYFTGTGNSGNVALWFADTAKQNNIEPQLINIAEFDRLSIEPPDPEALIAFVSPIHGFNYPPVMLHFIMRFPKGKNNIILMNTRAGMLIHKWITPGITGIAFYVSALILKLKGFSINAMYPVDLPSNWISLHPGLNARTVKYLHEKNKERVAKFASNFFTGKKNYKVYFEIIQDMICAPVSVGYYFIGRFALAKTFYASDDCNDCDICIKGCPVKAIKKIDNRPYWTFKCESCMKCMGNCPKKAIETAHGLIAVVSVVYSLVFSTLFYKYFTLFFFEITNGFARFIIGNLIFIGMLFLGYRFIHYCMRFRFVERMMVYTSLTKFRFWGRRYKALRD
jgi:ferredoxin